MNIFMLRATPDQAELERAIERAKQRVLSSPDVADKRWHFRELARLINQRTPEQVARMERAKGLTHG